MGRWPALVAGRHGLEVEIRPRRLAILGRARRFWVRSELLGEVSVEIRPGARQVTTSAPKSEFLAEKALHIGDQEQRTAIAGKPEPVAHRLGRPIA